jgi:hypothetical protein
MNTTLGITNEGSYDYRTATMEDVETQIAAIIRKLVPAPYHPKATAVRWCELNSKYNGKSIIVAAFQMNLFVCALEPNNILTVVGHLFRLADGAIHITEHTLTKVDQKVYEFILPRFDYFLGNPHDVAEIPADCIEVLSTVGEAPEDEVEEEIDTEVHPPKLLTIDEVEEDDAIIEMSWFGHVFATLMVLACLSTPFHHLSIAVAYTWEGFYAAVGCIAFQEIVIFIIKDDKTWEEMKPAQMHWKFVFTLTILYGIRFVLGMFKVKTEHTNVWFWAEWSLCETIVETYGGFWGPFGMLTPYSLSDILR